MSEGDGGEPLFLRTPQLGQMRDPLMADWNRAIAEHLSPSELADLIDFSQMNAIFQNFLEVVGLPVAIIDFNARVLASSRWQRICMEFHRVNQTTLARCLESDTTLSREMQQGKPYAIYRCLNGLTDCASPIIVEGRHIANLFIGQFFLQPPDLAYFKRQQEECGFEREAYFSALAEVPIVEERKLPAILNLLTGLAQQIARQSLAEKRALAAFDSVERQVVVRTAELSASHERMVDLNAQLVQEIAEHKRAEDEVRRLNDELELRVEQRTAMLNAANKELEEFSYSISHDMRTPLRAVDGFSRLLQEEYGDRLDEEGLRLLQVVRDNTRRMGELIDDILEFLRVGKQPLEPGVLDMAVLAQQVFAGLQAGAPAQPMRLEAAGLLPAWGDREMIRLVLANLLSNAVKFSLGEGEVAVELGSAQNGAETVYSVRDHGIGFDMRYADKLFKVFERVHPTGQYEGNAMGLALVKRIVERHGGRVWAESRVGEGATFYFSLPLRASAQ